MELILLERIEKLGQMGDVVTVKPGFARNYLLPQKKALRATKKNKEDFEGRRAQLEADNLAAKGEAEAVAKKLDGKGFVLVRQASDTGILYGSVATRDIAEVVTDGGFTLNRNQVILDPGNQNPGSAGNPGKTSSRGQRKRPHCGRQIH